VVRFKRFPDGDPAIRRRWLDLRHERWTGKLLNGLWLVPLIVLAMVIMLFVGASPTAWLIVSTVGLVFICGFLLALALLLPAGSARRTGVVMLVMTAGLAVGATFLWDYLLHLLV
jgi:hypothetical protein